MSISSKIALAMSAYGASFEEVHNSLEKIADEFAIDFGEWLEILSNADYGTLEYDMYQKWDVTTLLKIFKKGKGL